jgi:uncharacterized protein (DUF1697 family)
MTSYLALIRGINVGGKNPVSMAVLRKCLEDAGFTDVSTYIASGNVILRSDLSVSEVQAQIEQLLPQNFKLDDGFVKVLVLTYPYLRSVVENRPAGFGDQPEMYHSDAIFLIGTDAAQVMPAFDPREGVDTIWPGNGVIYSQRLSAERTKSRLNKVMGSTYYKLMTIRNWNTTTQLLEMLTELENLNQ